MADLLSILEICLRREVVKWAEVNYSPVCQGRPRTGTS